MIITGKTKILGIIGDPVEHSLSPVMQNKAIALLAQDYIYVPFPVKKENLAQAIAGLASLGVVGFNVTIPHKQTIIPFLTQVSPTAQMVGAVNTVWHTDRGWQGTNTDVTGFLAPLRQIKRNWSTITPVVLGNGGAARAVVVGCAELGCPEIYVLGRSQDKLDLFYQSWVNTRLEGRVKVRLWHDLAGLVSTTDLLINTTPVGMYPHGDQSPLEREMLAQLPPQAIAYDLIYTPNPTKFLREAQQQGIKAIDGLEMLVQQGAAALTIWLDQQAPIDIMRASLRQQLNL